MPSIDLCTWFVPVPHSLAYGSFVVQSEIREYGSYSSVLSQDYLGHLGSFVFPYI